MLFFGIIWPKKNLLCFRVRERERGWLKTPRTITRHYSAKSEITTRKHFPTFLLLDKTPSSNRYERICERRSIDNDAMNPFVLNRYCDRSSVRSTACTCNQRSIDADLASDGTGLTISQDKPTRSCREGGSSSSSSSSVADPDDIRPWTLSNMFSYEYMFAG